MSPEGTLLPSPFSSSQWTQVEKAALYSGLHGHISLWSLVSQTSKLQFYFFQVPETYSCWDTYLSFSSGSSPWQKILPFVQKVSPLQWLLVNGFACTSEGTPADRRESLLAECRLPPLYVHLIMMFLRFKNQHSYHACKVHTYKYSRIIHWQPLSVKQLKGKAYSHVHCEANSILSRVFSHWDTRTLSLGQWVWINGDVIF